MTVGVDCGVNVVRVLEEAVVEDGVIEDLVLEDSVEDRVVEVLVLEDLVEVAVVDVAGGAAWGVEGTIGGGDKPYTATDCVHGSVGHSWPWTSWAQSR